MAGWALLPLRVFLGVTFVFAGLQKLANPGFFDASNPTSIQSQLASAARVSPIHALVAHLQHVAVPLGVVIALGELAVGAATLVGLWSRAAAVGRDAAVVQPVPDGQLPFEPVLHGIRHRLPLRLDAAARGRSRRCAVGSTPWCATWPGPEPALGPATDRAGLLRGRAAGVRRIRRRARAGPWPGRRASPPLAPISAHAADRAAGPEPGDIDRRTFTLQAVFAAALAGVALLGAGLAAGLGRLGGKSTPTVTPARARPPRPPRARPRRQGAPGPPGPADDPRRTTPVTEPAGTRVGVGQRGAGGGLGHLPGPEVR